LKTYLSSTHEGRYRKIKTLSLNLSIDFHYIESYSGKSDKDDFAAPSQKCRRLLPPLQRFAIIADFVTLTLPCIKEGDSWIIEPPRWLYPKGHDANCTSLKYKRFAGSLMPVPILFSLLNVPSFTLKTTLSNRLLRVQRAAISGDRSDWLSCQSKTDS